MTFTNKQIMYVVFKRNSRMNTTNARTDFFANDNSSVTKNSRPMSDEIRINQHVNCARTSSIVPEYLMSDVARNSYSDTRVSPQSHMTDHSNCQIYGVVTVTSRRCVINDEPSLDTTVVDNQYDVVGATLKNYNVRQYTAISRAEYEQNIASSCHHCNSRYLRFYQSHVISTTYDALRKDVIISAIYQDVSVRCHDYKWHLFYVNNASSRESAATRNKITRLCDSPIRAKIFKAAKYNKNYRYGKTRYTATSYKVLVSEVKAEQLRQQWPKDLTLVRLYNKSERREYAKNPTSILKYHDYTHASCALHSRTQFARVPTRKVLDGVFLKFLYGNFPIDTVRQYLVYLLKTKMGKLYHHKLFEYSLSVRALGDHGDGKHKLGTAVLLIPELNQPASLLSTINIVCTTIANEHSGVLFDPALATVKKHFGRFNTGVQLIACRDGDANVVTHILFFKHCNRPAVPDSDLTGASLNYDHMNQIAEESTTMRHPLVWTTRARINAGYTKSSRVKKRIRSLVAQRKIDGVNVNIVSSKLRLQLVPESPTYDVRPLDNPQLSISMARFGWILDSPKQQRHDDIADANDNDERVATDCSSSVASTARRTFVDAQHRQMEASSIQHPKLLKVVRVPATDSRPGYSYHYYQNVDNPVVVYDPSPPRDYKFERNFLHAIHTARAEKCREARARAHARAEAVKRRDEAARMLSQFNVSMFASMPPSLLTAPIRPEDWVDPDGKPIPIPADPQTRARALFIKSLHKEATATIDSDDKQ